VEAAMLHTARSGGVSGMLHRTIGRRADLIEGTVDSLVGNRIVTAFDNERLGAFPERSFVFGVIQTIVGAYWITLFNFTAR
jgi:hypothetical protein